MSGAGDVAFKKLRILLDRMMLRRTKVSDRCCCISDDPQGILCSLKEPMILDSHLVLSLFAVITSAMKKRSYTCLCFQMQRVSLVRMLTREHCWIVSQSLNSNHLLALNHLSRLFKHFQSVSALAFGSYYLILSTPIRITRMRQMACHVSIEVPFFMLKCWFLNYIPAWPSSQE